MKEGKRRPLGSMTYRTATTPELLVVRFPYLDHPSLRPEPPRGLQGVEPLNVALVPPLLAPPLPFMDGLLSRGGTSKEEKAQCQREYHSLGGGSHGDQS